jgi:hypothetical protein
MSIYTDATSSSASHQFKCRLGDIVHFHLEPCAILIQDVVHFNAHRSTRSPHRPQAGHLETAAGPIEVARAEGEWISGEIVPGYFGPNTPWTFQGNFNCGLYRVEN